MKPDPLAGVTRPTLKAALGASAREADIPVYQDGSRHDSGFLTGEVTLAFMHAISALAEFQ
ncbi:MAG: hypothetical protein M3463_07585 [Verrucomicrobiota bacterium]|nr:hypothetical protein [Verrucomicrobiota bacterium]